MPLLTMERSHPFLFCISHSLKWDEGTKADCAAFNLVRQAWQPALSEFYLWLINHSMGVKAIYRRIKLESEELTRNSQTGQDLKISSSCVSPCVIFQSASFYHVTFVSARLHFLPFTEHFCPRTFLYWHFWLPWQNHYFL